MLHRFSINHINIVMDLCWNKFFDLRMVKSEFYHSQHTKKQSQFDSRNPHQSLTITIIQLNTSTNKYILNDSWEKRRFRGRILENHLTSVMFPATHKEWWNMNIFHSNVENVRCSNVNGELIQHPFSISQFHSISFNDLTMLVIQLSLRIHPINMLPLKYCSWLVDTLPKEKTKHKRTNKQTKNTKRANCEMSWHFVYKNWLEH